VTRLLRAQRERALVRAMKVARDLLEEGWFGDRDLVLVPALVVRG
jgi:hypothetical protein